MVEMSRFDLAGGGKELGTFQTPVDGKRIPEQGDRPDHDETLAMIMDSKPVTNGAMNSSL